MPGEIPSSETPGVRMTDLALWSLVLLCFSAAAALGGGLFEHFVVRGRRAFRTPQASPHYLISSYSALP